MGHPAVTNCNAYSWSEIVGLDNRFTGTGRYDASGNMISGTAYSFDAESRIISGGSTTYGYDGDGNRVRKSGTSNMLYWLGNGSDALTETEINGTPVSDYIFFGGKRVARFDYSNNSTHFYISDHLGSATVIASSAGAAESEQMYLPYGDERWSTGTDSNHYKFTGKERDNETGLDYFGTR